MAWLKKKRKERKENPVRLPLVLFIFWESFCVFLSNALHGGGAGTHFLEAGFSRHFFYPIATNFNGSLQLFEM